MRNLALMGGASMLALCLGMGPAIAHQTEILFAGQTEDVGDVTVHDDGTDLWITIDLDAEGKILLSAKLAISCDAEGLDGIPQTRKGNPIPGQFDVKESYDPLLELTTEDLHIPLTGSCIDAEGGEDVNVAVHVTVGDIGEECLATTQKVSTVSNTKVVDVDGTPQAPANSVVQTGTVAVWDATLGANKPGDGAQYVWNTPDTAAQPVGTVDFQHIYSCPAGEFIVDAEAAGSNQLTITCDDEYDVELNGGAVGDDTDWTDVETYDLSGLLSSPSNTLDIFAENVGGSPNPAMCIYVVDVTCSSCSDTAWADGETFSPGRRGGGGPKRNWATFIEYTTEGDD